MSSESSALVELWARRTRTPDRLRLLLIVAVSLAIVASVVTNVVVAGRSGSSRSIDEDLEPAIEAAQRVQASLAEADAAAANAFLSGGGEDVAQRERYEVALDEASDALSVVIAKVSDDETLAQEATTIEKSMIEYAGLVETARANNRQNFPVGAAFLSSASELLETDVYPATDRIANSRANSYRSSYNGQVGSGGVVTLVALFGILAVLALFLLGCHQILSKKFRRVINLPVLIAVLLSAGVLGWTAIGVTGQTSNLSDARDGYNDVRSLTNLRSLGLRTQSEESQFLIARGAIDESEFPDEFDAVNTELEALAVEVEDNGSLGLSASDVDDLAALWRDYQSTREGVKVLAVEGNRVAAIELALGDSADAFDAFDSEVERQLQQSQGSFESEMEIARGSLAYVDVVGPFLLLSGAVLMFVGLQQRIREYR